MPPGESAPGGARNALGYKHLLPTRVPILYLICGVLIAVSVVPMYFYAAQVLNINSITLKRNEMLLQNTITRSLADDIGQRQKNLDSMLGNLVSAIQVASGGDLTSKHVDAPELRALLENFVTTSPDLDYATLLNEEAKGIQAGRIPADDFLNTELQRAFGAAREGRAFTGQALSIGAGKDHRTVMVVSKPLMAGSSFVGMIGVVVNLNYLSKNLQDSSKAGLQAYVVDAQGRLVASGSSNLFTGQDMTKIDIVKKWVDSGGKAFLAETAEFTAKFDNEMLPMVGTFSPVPELGWAVVAQKPRREAYAAIADVQWNAVKWAVLAILGSLVISIFAARRITTPLDVLTQSSRAIAKGDFSQRVQLVSRTEFGELATTFNSMSDDLERFVAELKRSAEENKLLFFGSIQMLAGAVDEKDPYTRGHSDRVTRYSVLLATEMNLAEEEIEVVRIAAQLHDVGKIGIEDRILKKPGALTPEEYEIMKTHTTRGANILRPVQQLKRMLPGIELHHESLDGRGYPYGLKDEEIPLEPRIISVADTFDAMTTNRPYQAARPPEYAIQIINSLARNKFDVRVVRALSALHERGTLRVGHRAAVVTEEAAAAAPASAEAPPVGAPGD